MTPPSGVVGENPSAETANLSPKEAGMLFDKVRTGHGESADVLMPSGCRMGICMGCVLPMTSGAVRDLRTGDVTVAVPGETNPGGVPIQTCISAAAGDCHIDLEGATR